ncbi:MAG: alpha-ketoglutarate-dependent dioxygenase AlkB [Pirellulales bacterium]|nr:alpha-ketoglutarate-dependent dioxygenase AlkB [Pirellulales bacterium]
MRFVPQEKGKQAAGLSEKKRKTLSRLNARPSGYPGCLYEAGAIRAAPVFRAGRARLTHGAKGMSDNPTYDGFKREPLDETCELWLGRLPEKLSMAATGDFESLWQARPAEQGKAKMFGRQVTTRRWTRAYEHAYAFSGITEEQHALLPELAPLYDWARELDPRLNGLLVNWYSGDDQHQITEHHDKWQQLVAGAPIIMVSLGAPRTFRMVHPKTRAKHDFPVEHGSVIILPSDTNRVWKHAVLHFAGDCGQRISVTMRSFLPEAAKQKPRRAARKRAARAVKSPLPFDSEPGQPLPVSEEPTMAKRSSKTSPPIGDDEMTMFDFFLQNVDYDAMAPGERTT